MASPADRAIKAVLDEFEEGWTEKNVWRVQGTAVLSHACLERIAAKAGIRFDLPTIVRAERDEAVMLVVGYRGEQREWSVGECVIGQNYKVSGKQAAYPWAMSEKRAKDRVILKLLKLHGLAYSEEEADDFRASNATKDAPAPQEANKPTPQTAEGDDGDEPSSAERFIQSCFATIRNAKSGPDLRAWWQSEDHRKAVADFDLGRDDVDRLKTALTDRLQALGRVSDAQQPARANGHSHEREEARH